MIGNSFDRVGLDKVRYPLGRLLSELSLKFNF